MTIASNLKAAPVVRTFEADGVTRPLPARAVLADEMDVAKPIYAVWELTMKCDQPCAHCGSRAGHARPEELDTAQVLDVARRLADLGCREVALIGGEAYLRTDVAEIVSYLAGRGIRVGMQTGGRAFHLERAKMLRDAGLTGLGVSVDGPEEVHDILRGNVGSHAAALRALENAKSVGLVISSNTQINRLNYKRLRETLVPLRKLGIQAWQVQLTVPMGRAADRPDFILEPWHVVDVIDTLAAIQRDAMIEHRESRDPNAVPFDVFAGNNIGYFGPHEQVLRSRPNGIDEHWQGCRAGSSVMGIESDGTIKACPSLPTGPYAGGNVLELELEKIWNTSPPVRFARDRTLEELWGFCKTCYYADTCRAGCSWTAHCTLGKRGNNPFCYHRVSELKKRGIRERLELKEHAPDEPYDFGRYELVEEPWDAADQPQPKPVPRSSRRLPLV